MSYTQAHQYASSTHSTSTLRNQIQNLSLAHPSLDDDSMDIDFDGEYYSEIDDGYFDGDDATRHGNDGLSNSSMTSSNTGFITQHGRQYAASRQTWCPTDSPSMDTMAAIHLCMCILDSQLPNPYFRSPLPSTAGHVLDIGTGEGNWAIDVADRFPTLRVRGVDLTPPTAKWVPGNCTLEVDDITKEWVWPERFDLVHIRQLYGSLTPEESETMYKRIYENLVPGGWIEQVEFDVQPHSMNNLMPPTSHFASWGEMFERVTKSANHPIDTMHTMRGYIEGAGFTNVHEQKYKVPVGDWPKNRIYKEAGTMNMLASKEGVEGYAMYFLTTHGLPQPWSPAEVRVYVSRIKAELDQPWNLYQHARRVWAQKPYES